MRDSPLFGEKRERSVKARAAPADYTVRDYYHVDCPACRGGCYELQFSPTGKRNLCMLCRGLGKVSRTARQLEAMGIPIPSLPEGVDNSANRANMKVQRGQSEEDES